jgi:hypothetical protein
LPKRHLLRGQLQAAEAELLARGLTPASQAEALRRSADAAYRDATGLPLPQPMLLLN